MDTLSLRNLKSVRSARECVFNRQQISLPRPRFQQTISKSVEVSGFGLFSGTDVTLEFCPADSDHGIVFQRVDLPSQPRVPALIENVVPQARCTVIQSGAARVSVIEHVMATLAGLQIDNCLVKLNGPEPPGGDGSSLSFLDALSKCEIVKQPGLRSAVAINETLVVTENCTTGIAAQPAVNSEYQVGFLLDYGPGPIGSQAKCLTVTPQAFRAEIAPCRTFVLEQEVTALQAQGIGTRATTANAIVFGPDGPIENVLRFEDECVRHKILDCIGDFALLGCDLIGRFVAARSGHRLNHALIRKIRETCRSPQATKPQRQKDLLTAH